jgi:hypothetical protein
LLIQPLWTAFGQRIKRNNPVSIEGHGIVI